MGWVVEGKGEDGGVGVKRDNGYVCSHEFINPFSYLLSCSLGKPENTYLAPSPQFNNINQSSNFHLEVPHLPSSTFSLYPLIFSKHAVQENVSSTTVLAGLKSS